MDLSWLIGGAHSNKSKAKADTEIQMVLAHWQAPPWDINQIIYKRFNDKNATIIRSVEYWPDGKIKRVHYHDPSYTQIVRQPYKPWVLIGTLMPDKEFMWEYRVISELPVSALKDMEMADVSR